MNMYHSAMLRNLTGRSTPRLVLFNHPYHNNSQDILHQSSVSTLLRPATYGLDKGGEAIIIEALTGILVPLALSFHAASFVGLPITERTSKFKHLQIMTGVPGAVYWVGNFVFDFLLTLAVVMIFVFAIYLNNSYLVGLEYIGEYVVPAADA